MNEKVKRMRQEFLKLPIEERRKILEEQANDPEIQAYYRQLKAEYDWKGDNACCEDRLRERTKMIGEKLYWILQIKPSKALEYAEELKRGII